MKTIKFESIHGLGLVADWHGADSGKAIIMIRVLIKMGFGVPIMDMSGRGENDDASIEFDQWGDDLVMAVNRVYEMGAKSLGLLGFSLLLAVAHDSCSCIDFASD